MFDGLGINPQDIIQLTHEKVSGDNLHRLASPFPASGRYRRHISFLDDLTSLKALYRYRVVVIVEYFIALADTMSNYNGQWRERKIIPRPLTRKMKKALRSIGNNLMQQHFIQIEAIENKSDHDTAAITDWVKFMVDYQDILGFTEAEGEELERLENCLDGFHFGRTSEDVNSPVFALINRELFFKHVIPEVIAFQEAIIQYARQYDQNVVGLTHGQPAEPTTIGKQLMNTVAAINLVLNRVFLPYDKTGTQQTISFPVKTFGAIGNHSDLCAAYPDIDWIANDSRFIEALGPGLHLDMMATQASLYGEYKYIYDALCTISRHILKFAGDFWGWTSFQWFRRRKMEGVKGSSVMPNKYNPWRIEGAYKMLEKFIAQTEYTTKALMDYPYEGDMGRSIVMRDIGDDFAKFFIALGRIREELQLYEINDEKIHRSLQDNPGLVGGAAQTILKRNRVPGDAYRLIQQIMINPDGSYVSRSEFIENMNKKITQGIAITPEVGEEIVNLADPQNNTGYARELTLSAIDQAEKTIQNLREVYGSDENDK
jgi:adenylosuccinate lyase